MSVISFSSFLESSLKIHGSNGSCRTMYVSFYKSFHVDVSISIEDFSSENDLSLPRQKTGNRYWCPRRSSSDFLIGVCHPVLQILTLISDRCHFRLWPLKSTPVFKTDINRNYVIITQIRTPAKRFLYNIHFKLACACFYFNFLIHLELKRRKGSYTPPDFGPKGANFQTKMAQKPYPMGRYILIW